MCLGIPVRVVECDGFVARCEAKGIERTRKRPVRCERINRPTAPEAHYTLGNFYAQRGQAAAAETEYKEAIRLNPQFAPAAINLADLYGRRRGADSVVIFKQAIANAPDAGELRYGLGLADSAGCQEEALKGLDAALQHHPDNRDLLLALVTFNRDAGDFEAAMRYGEQLARLPPNESGLAAPLRQLRNMNKGR